MKTTNFEDRIGRNVAARLLDACDDLPHDITERLKVARMQALSKRNVVSLSASSATNSYAGVATLYMGDDSDNHNSIWTKFGMWLPFFLFLVGLIGIPMVQDNYYANEVASVDLELLGDELPPAAYTDPGFVHFLNTRRPVSE